LSPVEITLQDGPLHHLTTRAIAFSGALCTPDQAGREALAFLLASYTQKAGKKALYTELRNFSDTSFIQPVYEKFNFVYEEHLDYLIDLDCSPETVLLNIGSRTRKHIRKGLRKGSVTVEQVADRTYLSDWYELVTRTYRTAHVPLADRSLFETAFDILHPLGKVKFWLARIGSTCIAASVELLHKDVIYGWYGGVDREYSDEVPGEIIMWHILKWGAENGYRFYDFGGAGKPNEEYGVRDFKAKFGGKLVCFGRNTWVPNPLLLQVSKSVYSLYRKFI
jgi:CelD/BcsL family acetyltransferase involved in cellulose biosynthesis